jgi:dipeptide/tripeptide permease
METKMILNVLVLFPPLPLFWALFGQQGSRWTFQATRMDGDCGWFTIKPDQFTLINPFMALILIPSFEVFMYPLLKRIGIKSPLQKATLGGYLAVVSFVISAIIETQLDTKKLHMAWLLPQYFIMTLGEILITIPLMHFSYTEAPESMKSVLTAFRLLTIAFGNLIVVVVAGARMVDSQVYEFLLFAGLMFIDMSIFGILAKNYKFVDKEELKKLNETKEEDVSVEPESSVSHL